jgi:hypothetical protein
MPTVDVLYALVPDAELDQLEHDLRRRLYDDELRSRPAEPGRYACSDERLRQDTRSARHGALPGMVIGALIGLGVAWLTDASSAAIYVLLAAGGAALGGLIGAVAGMQLHEVLDDDPASTITVEPGSGVHLLEVRSERSAFWAHRVLDGHPEVCLLESSTALPTSTPPAA